MHIQWSNRVKQLLTHKRSIMASALCVVTANFIVVPPVTGQPTTLTGKWYGGSGDITVSHTGSGVIIKNVGSDYPTSWHGQMANNVIQGDWECPKSNQKGTFRFVYNPNYKSGYMERISGTYYIVDKWGKDPRDFYADREVKKVSEKSKGASTICGTSLVKPRTPKRNENLSGQWLLAADDDTGHGGQWTITVTHTGDAISWQCNADFVGTVSGNAITVKWKVPQGVTGTWNLTYDPSSDTMSGTGRGDAPGAVGSRIKMTRQR